MVKAKGHKAVVGHLVRAVQVYCTVAKYTDNVDDAVLFYVDHIALAVAQIHY